MISYKISLLNKNYVVNILKNNNDESNLNKLILSFYWLFKIFLLIY